MTHPRTVSRPSGRTRPRALAALAALLSLAPLGACASDDAPTAPDESTAVLAAADARLIRRGQEIFRHDDFGDNQFWTDTLRMHEVIAATVSPVVALGVGLKVDADALPDGLKEAILAGQVDLTDPATTVALLKLNAVVGMRGRVETDNGVDRLVRVGVTCALCHSTVDDSFLPGIGRRLDGWPNRDLDPGKIIALSPAVPDAAKQVYLSWGPGRYDPRFNIDGLNTPLVLPPAYGLRDVARETYTGDGPVSYWNAYVAVTQMHGQGTFIDERLGIRIVQHPDRVTPKLPALRAYQLSLPAPPPPPGSFDPALAERGRLVFEGAGRCASCHTGRLFTDVNRGILHAPDETGMDPAYAMRTVTKRYRTTPLRGLWQHPPYFHDGSAATLADVVAHYDAVLGLGLTAGQKAELVEYLKTL
jgi:mono/diheme cytochrome c family protein